LDASLPMVVENLESPSLTLILKWDAPIGINSEYKVKYVDAQTFGTKMPTLFWQQAQALDYPVEKGREGFKIRMLTLFRIFQDSFGNGIPDRFKPTITEIRLMPSHESIEQAIQRRERTLKQRLDWEIQGIPNITDNKVSELNNEYLRQIKEIRQNYGAKEMMADFPAGDRGGVFYEVVYPASFYSLFKQKFPEAFDVSEQAKETNLSLYKQALWLSKVENLQAERGYPYEIYFDKWAKRLLRESALTGGGRGWFLESHRHALARMGIRTKPVRKLHYKLAIIRGKLKSVPHNYYSKKRMR